MTAPARHVWSAHEADLQIFLLDAAGAVVPTDPPGSPFLQHCYVEGVEITGKGDVSRRPVTGRPRLKLTAREPIFTCQIDHLYFSRALELDMTHIFNRQQRLRLIFKLIAPDYGQADDESKQDFHTLNTAIAADWKITSRDGDVVKASVTFEAEEFLLPE